MFKQKTTTVVGAGASCELGLPSGEQLKDNIIDFLKLSEENAYGFSDELMIKLMKLEINNQFFDSQAKVRPWKEAAGRIIRGLPLALSIDNFLHSHQDDENVVKLGKLAIATCIARSERQSHLFPRQHYLSMLGDYPEEVHASTKGDELRKSWYPLLAQLLMSQVSRDAARNAFKNLNFVVFNYDRCLEHYLWMALQDYFSIDGGEAAKIMGDVVFAHPYGHLGILPWRGHKSSGILDFGATNFPNPWETAARLRTFTESVRNQTILTVKRCIEEAETIIVLGFGYLEQNIELLQRNRENTSSAQRVISTAYQISDTDQSVLRGAMRLIGNCSLDSTYIEAGSCRELFEHHRLLLSLSV